LTAALRDEVLRGGLAPGSPLREEHAAERYGASRHTVRAAFQRLVAERLAVAEPYRGVRVTEFGRDQIVALQQLRAALEAEAVRIADERFGGAWPGEVCEPAERALDRLAEIADASHDSAADQSVEVDWLEVERIHAEFHHALVEASGSARIVEAHAALGSELLLFLLYVRPHYSLDDLVTEHRALLEDAQQVGPDAIRAHLTHSTRLLLGP
jgi:DNA-binding GntR family transcriptional regulator